MSLKRQIRDELTKDLTPCKPLFTQSSEIQLSPEDVDKSTYYAFTLSPSDTFLEDYYKDPFNNFHTFYRSFTRKMYTFKSFYCFLCLELSKSNRPHFHGYIMIHNPVLFYMVELPKLTHDFSISLKDIKEPNEWLEYCNKQTKFIESLLLAVKEGDTIERIFTNYDADNHDHIELPILYQHIESTDIFTTDVQTVEIVKKKRIYRKKKLY